MRNALSLAQRIRNRLIQPFDVALSHIYRYRHPGPLERRLISMLRPLVVMCQPNDKWNLHVLAPIWVQAANCTPLEPLPEPKSIFIYIAFRGVFTHQIVLASILAWRGHHVTIGYLPKLVSPTKPPFEDHPSAKQYLSSALNRIAAITKGRIKCVDLTDNQNATEVNEELVKNQALYDTIMTHQKERLDFNDRDVVSIFNHRIAAGRITQAAIRNHFMNNDYDISLVGNGTTFDSAQFCYVLSELGRNFNSFEKFAFRGVRCMNHGSHFLNGDDIDFIWANREKLDYTSDPYLFLFRKQALKAIEERSQNSVETWLWELQRVPDQTVDEALRVAGISPDRSFILVCPNVVFDAGYAKITNIFPSMKDWLLKTVKFLLENTNHQVVVRAHPGEGLWWGGKEPVHEFLAEHGFNPGENLVVIAGQEKVNTYRLMEQCRFGVVFSSSTGLEMAVMGKHVVTGGDVIYSKRGYTYDAESQDKYFEHLARLSAVEDLDPLDEERRTLALLFYFVYHWVAQYPYPYDKPSGIARRRPKELVQSEEMQKYLPYFDLLSMNQQEFREHAGNYLSADKILERLKSINAVQ